MKRMLDKLAAFELEASSERGEFLLFALLLREDAQDKWDLVVSAQWLQPDNWDDRDSFIKQIRDKLSLDEFLMLSRIVLLEPDNPVLKALQRMINVQHGMCEIRDSSINSIVVKHAYVITSIRNGGRMRSRKRQRR